jgi:cytochrome c-type biogenesis protein CcmH/NrfG
MAETQNSNTFNPENNAIEALKQIDKQLEANPADSNLLIEKGKLHWRLGQRGAALSAYEKADKLAPNGPAATLLEHSNAIMDFFNPDLLNP